MVVGSRDAKKVFLVADELLMWQQTDINLYVITEYQLNEMRGPMKGVMMVIKFRRKIMSEMMTTYLPSILLMMITFATTFFKPVFFEAALSVNLTTMLVMTTIFISKMESLPPTSDIKMIDIWLILCQLVPFAQVVLLTAMEYLREEEQEDLEKEEFGTIKPAKDDEEDEPKPKKACVMPRIKDSSKNPIPVLTMIGKIIRSTTLMLTVDVIFAEKRVMPLTMVLASAVYLGVAASFYFH